MRAHRLKIIDIFIERVRAWVSRFATSGTAVIEVNELGNVAQLRHLRLEANVISAGATMQQKENRPFHHMIAINGE